jgi:DNA-binding transcriptional LysR family regulator
MAHPVVCILPTGHPLTKKAAITPADLDGVPFVSFDPESFTSRRVGQVMDAHGVALEIVMIVNVAPTLCEFVAAGVGISLVHPLIVGSLRDKLAIRPFEPAIQLTFQLCHIRDSRNARLVDAFMEGVREAASEISATILTPG